MTYKLFVSSSRALVDRLDSFFHPPELTVNLIIFASSVVVDIRHVGLDEEGSA